MSIAPRTLAAGLAAAIAISLSPTLAAAANPPPNDDLADATNITALPFHREIAGFRMRESTAEPDDPAFGCDDSKPVRLRHTIWYAFTATADTRIDASVSPGQATPRHVALYEGQPGSMTALDCSTAGINDFGGGARVGADVSAGDTVFLLLGVNLDRFDQPGKTVLDVVEGKPAPANDSVERPRAISIVGDGRFERHQDAFWATRSPDDPKGCNGEGDTVWYLVTNERDRPIQVLAQSGGPSVAITALVGSPGNLRQVATCRPGEGVGSGVRFTLPSGASTYLMIELQTEDGRVLFHGRATPLPEQANDSMDAATAVAQPDLAFAESLDVSSATSEGAEPLCRGGDQTVWYSFSPGFDMTVEAKTAGSWYDTTLAAFEQTDQGLEQIACRNNNLDEAGPDYRGGPVEQVRFPASPGHTYLFMVGAKEPATVLRFSIRDRVHAHLAATGHVSPSGAAVLHGTVTCSHRLRAEGPIVDIVQGSFLSQGYPTTIPCEKGTSQWEIRVRARKPFHAGAAQVTFLFWIFRQGNSNHTYDKLRVEKTVHLRGPRSASSPKAGNP